MNLEQIYRTYLEKVVKPLASEEHERDIELETSVWTDKTLGFFYNLGRREGHLVETNSRVVKKVDPDRVDEYMKLFQEPPKEYLVDLCWRKWDESTGKYWMELALELEWQPTAPGGYGDEDMDEDVYKLLDVGAKKRIGILGVTAHEKKHLSHDNMTEFVGNFQGYVEAGDFRDNEFLLIFVDDDDSEDHLGIGGRLIDSEGNGTDLPGYPYRELW